MPDYMVGNAPYGGSYTPPRLDTSWLGDLPQTYYQGAAARRQNALATAFPEGIPKDAKGQPDFGQMTNRIVQIAGPQAAGPILDKLMLMQMAGGMGSSLNEADRIAGGGDLPGPSPRAAAPQPTPGGPRGPNTGPDHLRPPVAQAGYNSEGDTIRSMVTERLPGADGQNLINYLAGKAFPGDENGADRTLSADETASLGKAIEQYRTAQAQQPQQPQSGTQPTAQGGTPAQAPQAGAAGPTPGPGPAPSGPYAQNAGGGTLQPRPAPGVPGAGGEQGVPPEFSQARRANLVRALQMYTHEAARRELVIPGSGKALESQMNALSNQIKSIDEFRSKYFQPTEKGKDTAASGFRTPYEFDVAKQSALDLAKADTERYSKQHTALVGAGMDSQHIIDQTRLFRSIINDPNFYSGTAENVNLAYKKAIASFGGNPNAAVPQEAFRKIMATNILNQVAQMKADAAASGSTSSRIFQSQIRLMEQAAQNPANTIAANRFLTEVSYRSAARSQHVAQMADEYAQKNGRLDAKFNIMLRKYDQDNPLFKDKEINNPSLLSAPRFDDAHALKAWRDRGGKIPPLVNIGGDYYQSGK